jgi:hypothetical protein
VNTYSIFAETNRFIISSTGRVGCIVPTGIATDSTTKEFFGDLVNTKTLMSLYDFENRKKLFPDVDSRMKFSLLTLTGKDRRVEAADFAFFALDVADLKDPERRFPLSAEDIRLLHVVQAVTKHLVRTGTLCEHICHGIAETPDAERDPDLEATLRKMAHDARDLFRQGLHIFETRDIEHSEELEAADDRVDQLHSEGMNLAVNPGDKERVGSPQWRVRAASGSLPVSGSQTTDTSQETRPSTPPESSSDSSVESSAAISAAISGAGISPSVTESASAGWADRAPSGWLACPSPAMCLPFQTDP